MQNNKLFSFCNIYFFLWIVYGLQSIVFGAYGTIYSQLILAFLLGTSIYYLAYAFMNYKTPRYMKGLGWMVLLFTVYGLVLIIKSPKSYTYLQYIYNSLLPIFPFYVFTRKGNLNNKNIRLWTIVSFLVVTIQYFQHQYEYQLMLLVAGKDRDDFTNNFGYEFLSVIPLLAFFGDKKIIQYFGLGYAMVFILLSMKRGAILIAAICLIWFIFISMKDAEREKKGGIILLSCVIIIVSYYYVQKMMAESVYFNTRLERTMSGDSSGRDSMYARLLEHFLHESKPLYFLFGNGANATLKIIKAHAHNDWLELAINQGVLGVLVYLFYWLGFFKACRRTKFDREIFLAVTLLFISNFIRSFFSMSYGDMSRFTTLCIGYCMGMISEHDHQFQNRQIIS